VHVTNNSNAVFRRTIACLFEVETSKTAHQLLARQVQTGTVSSGTSFMLLHHSCKQQQPFLQANSHSCKQQQHSCKPHLDDTVAPSAPQASCCCFLCSLQKQTSVTSSVLHEEGAFQI
jgi:hypothetical protein